MKCRFIDTGRDNAYANMAIDEAILNFCKVPTLRVYQFLPAAITIGYSQDARKEINVKKCTQSNINIVRRVTGGKAVFHDKDITYSFILPENSALLPRSIPESYKAIAHALVLALKKIGVKAEMKKQPEKIVTPLCFNSSNWYELTVNNKKISGSAQRRLRKKILQHGPLLIDFDYKINSILFNGRYNKEKLKKRITSIKKELGSEPSYEELAEAIKYGFKKSFGFDFFDDCLTNEEVKLAKTLEKEKYAREEWNLKLNAMRG